MNERRRFSYWPWRGRKAAKMAELISSIISEQNAAWWECLSHKSWKGNFLLKRPSEIPQIYMIVIAMYMRSLWECWQQSVFFFFQFLTWQSNMWTNFNCMEIFSKCSHQILFFPAQFWMKWYVVRHFDGIIVTYNIPGGSNVTLTKKSPKGQLGQWLWQTSKTVKRHYYASLCEKRMMSLVAEHQETPWNANLDTTGQCEVIQVEWPGMTLERSGGDVEGQMWSASDLDHASCLHSSQWQRAMLLEWWFCWKISHRLFLLWHG